MKFKLIVCFVIICIVGIESKHLPSYIKACKKSNPNENDCAKKSAIAALPHLIKGDPEFKIPVLSPLGVPKLEIKSGDNLKLTLLDSFIYGLDLLTIKDLNIDLQKKQVHIIFNCDWASIAGNYIISGQILVLPITGNGLFNMTFYDAVFDHTFYYKLIQKGGKDHIQITNSSTGIQVKNAYFNLENLFNGNKQLGEHMNTFLNYNSQQVLKDLGYPVTKELIQVIALQVLNSIFSVVPYDEIIL